MPIYLGVDPGKYGGLAVINGRTDLVDVLPMPDKITPLTIADTIRTVTPYITHAVYERQTSFGGEGVTSANSLGQNFMAVIGAIELLHCCHKCVDPRTWKKYVFSGQPPAPKGLTRPQKKKHQKDLARKICEQTWGRDPFLRTQRCTTLHDGMCDAACIALFAQHDWEEGRAEG